MTECTYRFWFWVGVTGIHALVFALRIIIAIYSNSWTMFVFASVGGEAEEVEMKDWSWLGWASQKWPPACFGRLGRLRQSCSLVLLSHRHSVWGYAYKIVCMCASAYWLYEVDLDPRGAFRGRNMT